MVRLQASRPSPVPEVRDSLAVAGVRPLPCHRRSMGAECNSSRNSFSVSACVQAGSAPKAPLCRPPTAGAWNAPYSELPPNFDRLENVAIVVREFVPAVRLQKLRAQILRQYHPMRPTCAHGLSWSWRSAACALSHVSSRRVPARSAKLEGLGVMLRAVSRVRDAARSVGCMVRCGQALWITEYRRPRCAAGRRACVRRICDVGSNHPLS